MARTMLEQEFYEQMRDNGLDEYSADFLARDWAMTAGEYDQFAGIGSEPRYPEGSEPTA